MYGVTWTLYLVLATALGNSLANSCPEKCICDIVNGIYDCHSAGLTKFPSNLPSPSSVKELLLSGNSLSGTNLLDMMLFKNIQKLDMTACSLTEIDETMFENSKNLTEIRFGENLIKDVKLKTFQGLSQLKYLDLSGNALVEVPGGLFMDLRKLEKLDLSRNLIRSVHKDAFQGLISVELLDISTNQLRAVPVDSLATLPSLRSLSLGGNAIDLIPSHAFRSLRNLQKLQLHDNQINTLSDLAFHGKDSVELPKLKYLSLRTNRLRTVPVLSLQNLSALLTLDLSDNQISSLQKNSFTGLTRLRQLYMNEMPKLVTIAPYSFSAMVNLEELQLHRNVKLQHLPSMTLGGLPNLKQVDLCCNALTTLDDDVIENWNQLQIFDLRLNPWHCSCDLGWLGEYLKNHSSSRMMSGVKCHIPVELRNTPVMNIDEQNCMNMGAWSAQRGRGGLANVLYIMIGCVIGAFLAVGVYIMYRYKGKFIKHFHDQMRYRPQEDQGNESLSSRLSINA